MGKQARAVGKVRRRKASPRRGGKSSKKTRAAKVRKIGKWVFDARAAEFPIRFIERFCCLTKGRKTDEPLRLLDFQKEVLSEIYGWVDPATGHRKHTLAYCEWPKKNSKSYLAATIAIFQAVCDPAQGKEIYIASGNLDQSRIVFDEAKRIILKNPDLKRRFRVFDASLSYPATNSFIRPLTSEAKTKEGLNIHTLIVDEFHIFDKELFATLKYGLSAEENPLTVIITTAGIYDEESIGYQMHLDAVKLLEGTIQDESMYANIYAAKEEDLAHWDDPKLWKRVNPGLGITKTYRALEDAATKARNNPIHKNDFLRYHLNVWVNDVAAYFNIDKWNACVRTGWSLESLAGRECIAGLDLSSSQDLTALTLLFPPQDGLEEARVWSECWLPEFNLHERERNDHVQYSRYAEEGFLHLTEGDLIDHNAVISRLVEIGDLVKVVEVGFDKALASKVESDLTREGFNCVQVPQTWIFMSPATKELSDLILAKRVAFPNNGLLRWCFSNAKGRMDDRENIMLLKKKSKNRIDPVIATVMAISRWMDLRQNEGIKEFVYEPGQMLLEAR